MEILVSLEQRQIMTIPKYFGLSIKKDNLLDFDYQSLITFFYSHTPIKIHCPNNIIRRTLSFTTIFRDRKSFWSYANRPTE